MAAITPTYAVVSSISPNFNLVTVTATPGATSDTITIAQASAGIQSIASIVGWAITAGLDAALSYLQVSFSGLVLTVASFDEAGTVATDWTGAAISVTVIGNT